MAFKKEDLLKFSKSVEFGVKVIEDDSSSGDDGTEVKILHLTKEVHAIGSIPTPDGKEMQVKGTKVHVAATNIEKMLEGLEEQDGVLIYKGPMHLDVSKPNGRMVNGNFVVTKPAKIWLTATKFSRGGAALRTNQTNNLNSLVAKMFGGGVVDLAAEAVTVTDTTGAGDGAKTGPEVVANQS